MEPIVDKHYERPRRRRRKPGFFMGCLFGAVLTLVAFIIMGVVVRRNPEGYSGMIQALFGADRPTAAADGATPTLSLEQMQAIRGIKPSFQIILSEADINSYIDEHPGSMGLPKGFGAPKVEFRDGQLMVGIRTKVLLWPVRVEVWMRPEITAGEVTLEIVEVHAGRVSLPGEFRQQIQNQMQKVIMAQLDVAGVEAQAVEVGNGTLTVTAQLQPTP